jgi:hypothetical protein
VVRCLLPESPIVEMVVDGLLTAEEGAEAMTKGLALSREHDAWSTLANFRHMRQTAPAGDIVALADVLAHLGVQDRWQEAVILPMDPITAVWVQLWETAALNRGLRVKSFRDRDVAIAWLLEGDAASVAPAGGDHS